MEPPRSPTSCGSLPPEGAAAPADWQSQIRGPCLKRDAFAGVAIYPFVLSLSKDAPLRETLLECRSRVDRFALI